mgnify:CR=1 FL=1
MSLMEQLLQTLTSRGSLALANRLRTDWSQPAGHWHSYSNDHEQICSFLNKYLDHNDDDARLSLCPSNGRGILFSEIMSDVIPVIGKKLGVGNG